MWITLVWMACGNDVPIRVVPEVIDFGDVPWEETATRPLFIDNVGDETQLVSVEPSSSAVVLIGPVPFPIAPGERRELTVAWTASAIDGLDERLDVQVGAASIDSVPVRAVVTRFPILETPAEADFGDVNVSCGAELRIELPNVGLAPLTITSVELKAHAEFALENGTPTPSSPREVAAGAAAPVFVTFAATGDVHDAATVLTVASNDPVHPVQELEIRGHATLPGMPSLQTWTVERPDAVTVLIALNPEAVRRAQTAGDDAVNDLSAFVERLRGNGMPYRLAIIGGGGSGGFDTSVGGKHAYIDDTFSGVESSVAISAMVDALDGDVDQSLALLDAALDAHRDWLLEDPLWAQSTLGLVVVNVDMEQSPMPADKYVERYRQFKGDARRLAVHGVAGLPPGGCSDEAWSAFPSQNLFDATVLGQGRFFDFCDGLATNLDALADAMVAPMFPLGTPPVGGTLEVAVDGEPMETGWWYYEWGNAIVFDRGSYPPDGAQLDVSYNLDDACP